MIVITVLDIVITVVELNSKHWKRTRGELKLSGLSPGEAFLCLPVMADQTSTLGHYLKLVLTYQQVDAPDTLQIPEGMLVYHDFNADSIEVSVFTTLSYENLLSPAFLNLPSKTCSFDFTMQH